ncbi:MAG TPA: TauD/TfdA family dioxygenase [Ilumatobacteraceae bacterium]
MSIDEKSSDVREDPGARLYAKRSRMSNSVVMTGPCTYLAEERDRLAELRFEHFDVVRMAPTVGAELHGIDLTVELAQAAIYEIRAALHAFKVIFFRDQPLTTEQHVAFAGRFGALELHPFLPASKTTPELVRFAKDAFTSGYENGWHHDVTWRAEPSMGAVLHAITVPPVGGDTLFADMYAAYDGLPADVKERIEGMSAEHDFMQAFGRSIPPDKLDAMREQFPIVVHPVVPRHEATGRPYLYVNRGFTKRIIGVSDSESVELIDLLARQADYPEHQCRFVWRQDSIAFWDNRAVQHYANSDYWPQVRVMERASIIGSRPTR